jgi:threonine synthase
MRQCYKETEYILDPHGACGYQALKDNLRPGEVGVFCETAHPAKFKEKVDQILGTDIAIPERLQAFMKGQKQSIALSKNFADFKQYLLQQ